MPTWPLRPDWAEPWRETIEHPTDVMAHANGSEKRVALRSADRPIRRAAFRCATVDEATAQTVMALVEANHTAQWTVPDWHTDDDPVTSRTGRLVNVQEFAVEQPTGRSVAFAVEFEIDSVEGQT
jgi:hypothetical protein